MPLTFSSIPISVSVFLLCSKVFYSAFIREKMTWRSRVGPHIWRSFSWQKYIHFFSMFIIIVLRLNNWSVVVSILNTTACEFAWLEMLVTFGQVIIFIHLYKSSDRVWKILITVKIERERNRWVLSLKCECCMLISMHFKN